MFPDRQRGSAHAEALAWLNLGRLALVIRDGEGEYEAHGSNAVARLLENLGDETRALMLVKESLAAGKTNGARIALDELLARCPDHAEAQAIARELDADA
jgi:hypothetical protein